MSWTAEGKERFYHIARQAEIVVIKDRDVVAFIPEAIGLQGSQGMWIYRTKEDAGGFFMWQSDPSVVVEPSERVLLWTRMSATEIVSGFRWVPYILDVNPDEMRILPIRECFSPRVTYDRTSNMLHLWFWTNEVGLYGNGI